MLRGGFTYEEITLIVDYTGKSTGVEYKTIRRSEEQRLSSDLGWRGYKLIDINNGGATIKTTYTNTATGSQIIFNSYTDNGPTVFKVLFIKRW